MDTLSNVVTKIRNAYLARQERVTLAQSKLVLAFLKLLEKEGYLKNLQTEETTPGHSTIQADLVYVAKEPALLRIRRLSRPGRRLYVGVADIPRPKAGFGTIILSTPKGLMTGKEARKTRLGGEVLCEVIRGGAR